MGIGLLVVVALLTAAAVAMFSPLRAARKARVPSHGDTGLEIGRVAKLGEIKDLELDFRLGKLSADDYHAVNATLRAEAVEIIRRIEAAAEPQKHPQGRSRRP